MRPTTSSGRWPSSARDAASRCRRHRRSRCLPAHRPTGVKVMATVPRDHRHALYDHEAVIDRYGIAPELIPDFFGLKGDTSDNIPGVPGIGDKTAAQLLQQFGTIEGVLDHIDEVSGEKRRENLRANAEAAAQPKRLTNCSATSRPASTSTRRRPGARSLPAARRLPALRASRPSAPGRGKPRAEAAPSQAAGGPAPRAHCAGRLARRPRDDGGRARGARGSPRA